MAAAVELPSGIGISFELGCTFANLTVRKGGLPPLLRIQEERAQAPFLTMR